MEYNKDVKEPCHKAGGGFLKNRVEQLRKERGLNQDDFAKQLADVATVEKAPKVEGRSMTMFLTEKR